MEILSVTKADNGYIIKMVPKYKNSGEYKVPLTHVVTTKADLLEIVTTFLQSEDE